MTEKGAQLRSILDHRRAPQRRDRSGRSRRHAQCPGAIPSFRLGKGRDERAGSVVVFGHLCCNEEGTALLAQPNFHPSVQWETALGNVRAPEKAQHHLCRFDRTGTDSEVEAARVSWNDPVATRLGNSPRPR